VSTVYSTCNTCFRIPAFRVFNRSTFHRSRKDVARSFLNPALPWRDRNYLPCVLRLLDRGSAGAVRLGGTAVKEAHNFGLQ
jgi:hypothetical protein